MVKILTAFGEFIILSIFAVILPILVVDCYNTITDLHSSYSNKIKNKKD